MDALDEIVTGELAKRVIDPQRLYELLDAYIKRAVSRKEQARENSAKVRQSQKDVEAAITRLLQLVENGAPDEMKLGTPIQL